METSNPVLPSTPTPTEASKPATRKSDMLLATVVVACKEVEKIESRGTDRYVAVGSRLADAIAMRFAEDCVQRATDSQGKWTRTRGSADDITYIHGAKNGKGGLIPVVFAAVDVESAKQGVTFGGDGGYSRCLKLWCLGQLSPDLLSAGIGRNRLEALLPMVRFDIDEHNAPCAVWQDVKLTNDRSRVMTFGEQGIGSAICARLLDPKADNYLRTADDIQTAVGIGRQAIEASFNAQTTPATGDTGDADTPVTPETPVASIDADKFAKLCDKLRAFIDSAPDGDNVQGRTDYQTAMTAIVVKLMETTPADQLAALLRADKDALGTYTRVQQILAVVAPLTPAV